MGLPKITIGALPRPPPLRGVKNTEKEIKVQEFICPRYFTLYLQDIAQNVRQDCTVDKTRQVRLGHQSEYENVWHFQSQAMSSDETRSLAVRYLRQLDKAKVLVSMEWKESRDDGVRTCMYSCRHLAVVKL